MGRPTKLNDDVQGKIIAFVAGGAYIETAAAAAGIHKSTLYDWLRRGADGERRYRSFSDAVQRAQAEADVRDISVINRAANGGTWQAAAWKLERRHPDLYGRRARVELSKADGPPVDESREPMTDDQLIAETVPVFKDFIDMMKADAIAGRQDAADALAELRRQLSD